MDQSPVGVGDGGESALMIRHRVGVTPVNVYELKRVDSDYFAEE